MGVNGQYRRMVTQVDSFVALGNETTEKILYNGQPNACIYLLYHYSRKT